MGMKPLKEVADSLGVKEVTLIAAHKRGELPVIVIGAQKFIEDDDLKNWIVSRRLEKPVRRKLTAQHLEKIRASQERRRLEREAAANV